MITNNWFEWYLWDARCILVGLIAWIVLNVNFDWRNNHGETFDAGDRCWEQGLSIAFHLAERGLKTVVLERSSRQGATGRSSGLVRMHYDLEAEFARLISLVLPQLARARGR
jgi:hypothetical protein